MNTGGHLMQNGMVDMAFDVTPPRLISGLITERGVAPPTEAGLLALYPERKRH